MTGDIELGKTNIVAPQQAANGAVIDINDGEKEEIEKSHQNGKIEKTQERPEEDSGETHDDENDEDDDENRPLGLCRFFVKHHRLAFGRFVSFKYCTLGIGV